MSLASEPGVAPNEASSYGQQPDVTWLELAATFLLGLFLAFVSIVAFSFIRRTASGGKWFVPKRGVCPDGTPPDLRKDTIFGWIWELYTMPDGKILMYCGYDVLIYLKCLKLGFWTCAYFAPFGLLAILPNNFLRGSARSGWNRTTISNLSTNEHLDLALPLAGTILIHCILMALTINTHLEFKQMRRSWMKQREHNCSIFVTDIPLTPRSESVLKRYFQSIYRTPVTAVNFVQRVDDLDRAVASRDKTVGLLERSIMSDLIRGNLGNGTEVKPQSSVLCDGRQNFSGSEPERKDRGDVESGDGGPQEESVFSVAESLATLKLRVKLEEQNKKVLELQSLYISQAKKHDDLMATLAPEILAKRLNVTVSGCWYYRVSTSYAVFNRFVSFFRKRPLISMLASFSCSNRRVDSRDLRRFDRPTQREQPLLAAAAVMQWTSAKTSMLLAHFSLQSARAVKQSVGTPWTAPLPISTSMMCKTC